jgi:mono/diheme cytochrome c family protein
MFKWFLLGIIFTLAAEAAAGYAVLRSGAIPANADSKPGWFERWAASTSLRATLDRESPKGPDPVRLTDANLSAGIKLYRQHCAVCHGTAKGDASPTPISKGEYPAPPQLASAGVEDDPTGWTFWKIKHGIRWTGMPSWTSILNDQQIWTLALFLKHMDTLPPAAEQEWQKVQD